MARDWQHLRVQVGALRITGSIQKICNGAAANNVVITDWKAGSFKSLIYPDGTTADVTGSQNIWDGSGDDDITVKAGACLDGPFMAVHVNAEPCLIYHNGIANTEAS